MGISSRFEPSAFKGRGRVGAGPFADLTVAAGKLGTSVPASLEPGRTRDARQTRRNERQSRKRGWPPYVNCITPGLTGGGNWTRTDRARVAASISASVAPTSGAGSGLTNEPRPTGMRPRPRGPEDRQREQQCCEPCHGAVTRRFLDCRSSAGGLGSGPFRYRSCACEYCRIL